jgi:hypothetical protein
MSFLPFVGEAIGEYGLFITEGTGSSFLGAQASGQVAGQINQATAEGSKSLFDRTATWALGKERYERYSEKLNQLSKMGAFSYGLGPTTGEPGVGLPQVQKPPTPEEQVLEQKIKECTAHTKEMFRNKPKEEPHPTDVLMPPVNPPSAYVPSSNGIIDAKKRGEDLGKFISLTATALDTPEAKSSATPLTKAYEIVVGSNPFLSYLMPSVSKFQAGLTLPTNEEYKKVAAVYNGKNLDYRNVLAAEVNGYMTFSARNEVGEVITWNTEWNSHKVVPPLWGVWVGPNSPNNKSPTSLLDLFAFFHDYSYHVYGNFNELGDYQLISRVYQNLDRMSGSEREIALTTVKYFSTIGAAARAYAGNKGHMAYSQDSTNEKGADDSIFPILIPEAETLESVDYSEAKDYFFEGLETGLRSETGNSSVMASYTVSNRNQLLINYLENIEIEVL